jgi:hypothetical protein
LTEGDHIRRAVEAYRCEFEERRHQAAAREARRRPVEEKAAELARSADVRGLLQLLSEIAETHEDLVDDLADTVRTHLAELGDRATKRLLEVCADKSWSVPSRRFAVMVLQAIGGSEADVAIPLATLIKDVNDDGLLRGYAIETLSLLGLADTGFIGDLLYDPDTHVRWHAAKALVRLGGVSATKLLLRAACSKESHTRGDTLEAIGSYGRNVKEALPLIFESRASLGYDETACVGIGAVLRYSHPDWWGRAEEELENAIQRFPACAYARFLLGDLWMTMACNSHSVGKLEESQQLHKKALGALWKAVAIDSIMPDPHYAMTKSPWLPYDEIARQYQRALALDKSRSSSFAWDHWWLAMKASETGDLPLATAGFMRAMLLKPDMFTQGPTHVRPSGGAALTCWARAMIIVAQLGQGKRALTQAWEGTITGWC